MNEDIRANPARHANALIVIGAAGTVFTWISAWLTGLYVDPGSWPMRYKLFGYGFLLAVIFVGWWMRRIASQQREAEQFFRALCRMKPQQSSGAEAAEIPVPLADNPWHEVAHELRASFFENCQRAMAAEHQRAAADVRLHRLRHEHDQLRTIVKGLAEPVVAIDNFDDVILTNPSADLIVRRNGESTEDRALAKLVRCEKLIEMLTDTRRRKTPTQRSGEVEIEDVDGDLHWYRVTTASIPGSVDGVTDETRKHGAVAVLRDISGHKAAQKRNAEFVSAVSHEMKTPLAGIKAYVELLADGDAEDETTREEFLNVINSQTDRLQRLIDNLLNLARIEAGVVNVSKQSRSLNELLEEAFHVVFPTADAKRIKLVADLSPMYLGVLVDRDMIMQAAINLLSNAIKYTPEEGTVTLRSKMVDNDVMFEVEDTGVGLSAEDCEKVFEKFYRVRKDRKMAQGTGLGLPLAKHIVEDVHSGRLTVSSQVGLGSTFRVVLPSAGQISA